MSEALAEDGSYNAVGFTYSSDYYDPSEPTEEEEPSKQRGERELPGLLVWGYMCTHRLHAPWSGLQNTSLDS